MKHSIFNSHKAGISQGSAFDTYGELEEIIDDIGYQPYILNRDADSSESEDDQISQEMAKYNKKLKEESLNSSSQSPFFAVQNSTSANSQYGRPPFSCSQQTANSQSSTTSSAVRQRFRPVRSITPEEDEQEEEKLPEVISDKDKTAILNCVNFQQLFKGNPVPAGDSSAGYGRPPSAFLQKPIQPKPAVNATSIFADTYQAPAKSNTSIFENVRKPETSSHYGAPLNYSDQLWFQSKKQMQDQIEKATRNVDKTNLSMESLSFLDFNAQVVSLSKKQETSCGESNFFDSIHTRNGNQTNVVDKPSSVQATASPTVAFPNGNKQKEVQSAPTCYAPFTSRSKVLDALLAKANPVSQVVDKKWEVNDDFHENIDWNGMTEVDWSLAKTDSSKPTTSPIPKKKGPEINWDLEEESKKDTNASKNDQAEGNKAQELHFFFDLNLNSSSSNDLERNQSQQQTQQLDNTQPRSYSSLTHMPMPSSLDQSSNVIASSSKERKPVEIAPFIDLSKELKKCQKEVGSQTNDGQASLTIFHGSAVVGNESADKMQSSKETPFEKETLDEKKQKILYMAAAICMATMAAPEGILRLSKLEKIVRSVFGGYAKPELYGHKDWLSFISQHCRKNIQVIPKNRYEALLVCNISEDENSS